MLVDLEGEDDLEVQLCRLCADEMLKDIDPEYAKDCIFAEGIFNNDQIVDNLDRLRKEHNWVWRRERG